MSLKKAFREHRLHGARSAAPGASRAVLACPAARAELWGRTGGPASDAQPGLCPSPESPRSAHALSATSHNDNRCPLGGLFSGAPSPSGCYLVFVVVVVVVFEWPVRQGAVKNLLTASLVEKRRPTGLSDSAGTETSSPPPPAESRVPWFTGVAAATVQGRLSRQTPGELATEAKGARPCMPLSPGRGRAGGSAKPMSRLPPRGGAVRVGGNLVWPSHTHVASPPLARSACRWTPTQREMPGA